MSNIDSVSPIIHRNLVVVEASNPGEIDALYSNASLRGGLWYRIDPLRVIVNPSQAKQIISAINK
jgi:hypothetical protein